MLYINRCVIFGAASQLKRTLRSLVDSTPDRGSTFHQKSPFIIGTQLRVWKLRYFTKWTVIIIYSCKRWIILANERLCRWEDGNRGLDSTGLCMRPVIVNKAAGTNSTNRLRSSLSVTIKRLTIWIWFVVSNLGQKTRWMIVHLLKENVT